MTAPRRMTANTLDALKGWPRPHAVDFRANFADSVTVDPVLAGHCVSLDSDGNFVLGCGNSNVMPMFLFHDSDDPDVQNDGGDPATEAGVWIGVTPSGKHLGLVAIGAYELISTEFVDDTYAPNDMLKSITGNLTNSGKLQKGTLGTNMIVGQVSRGVMSNGYGHNALAFWPITGWVYP